MAGTQVMKCDHCNKEAVFYERGKGTQGGLNEFDTLEYVDHILTTWRALECSVCSRPILEETHTTYEIEFVGDQGTIFPTLAKSSILYPSARTPISLTNVPKAIEKEYKFALKYQNNDPNACVVYIGRALDEVCNYEKIKDGRLIERLNQLIKLKNLPEPLATMSHQIRLIRNMGAHADGKHEINEEDVPIILDFLEAILEYLYVAPAKIEALRTRLEARK